MGSVGPTNPPRQLKVVLDRDTSRSLGNSGYQLQVAKSVVNQNGNLIFNMVWQSKVLAPIISICWAPVYGFNWTTQIPNPGLTVEAEGQWMQCNIGQAVDLDQYGFFNLSASAPDPASMKIGKNGYVSQGDGGVIHIIVGVQDPVTKNFNPIFVDPDGIYPNMSGTWQPQEKVQWWYESGDQTSTMFDKHDSAIEVGDFSSPDTQTGTFKKESSYSSLTGIWKTKPIKCKPSSVLLSRTIFLAPGT